MGVISDQEEEEKNLKSLLESSKRDNKLIQERLLDAVNDKNEVVLDEEKFRKIKEKYFWIEFDEYGFEFAGNWSDDINNFFVELSGIIKKGEVIIDYDGDEPRDIKQFKISKNRPQII